MSQRDVVLSAATWEKFPVRATCTAVEGKVFVVGGKLSRYEMESSFKYIART
jgi:hypothetical protein